MLEENSAGQHFTTVIVCVSQFDVSSFAFPVISCVDQPKWHPHASTAKALAIEALRSGFL
jgi:hypothetical protein